MSDDVYKQHLRLERARSTNVNKPLIPVLQLEYKLILDLDDDQLRLPKISVNISAGFSDSWRML